MLDTDLNLDDFARHAQDGIIVIHEGILVYANSSAERILQYQIRGLIGVHIDDLSRDFDDLRGDFTGRDNRLVLPRRHETNFKCQDGSPLPVEITRFTCAWRDSPAHLLVIRDLTDSKHNEAALREIETRFNQLTKNIRDVFFVRNLITNQLIYISPAYEEIWKRPIAALQEDPMDFIASVHPDDRDSVLEAIKNRIDTEEGYATYQYRVLWPNGDTRWIRARTFPIHNEEDSAKYVAGIAEDYTDQKLAEEERKLAESALKMSEERLRHSLQYANIGNWDWDLKTGRFYCSEILASLLGHEAHMRSTTLDDFLAAAHPEDREKFEATTQGCIASGKDCTIEHRVIWPDGSIHWLQQSSGVIYDDDGQPKRMLGIAQDITRRKLAEQALLDSENKYRVLMENASDAILLGSLSANIIDANRRAEEFLGYTRDELLGMHGKQIHPEEDYPNLEAAFQDLSTKGSSLYEHLVLRKDGSVVNAEVAATVIEYQGQQVVMAIFRDITARKRAELERLAQTQAQRDALVREVHHRIKNNLQGVVGLLRQHITRRPDLEAPLASAIRQVNTMAVVHGLHGQQLNESIILCEMVPAICHSAHNMTGAAINPNITIDVISPIRIITDEAVPLALILNELIFNAIKHQAARDQPITVDLHDDGDGAQILISTPGATLPSGFDFLSGEGLGTGLSLVRSLMPAKGFQLLIRDEQDGVISELRLEPPVTVPRAKH